MSRRRPGRGGLTLVEVVVSTAILGLLTLALLATIVPMTSTSSETAIGLDMDRAALRLFSELRRELRQTGYEGTTPKFGNGTIDAAGAANLTTARTSISYHLRESATTWSATPTTWRLTGTNVERTLRGLTTFATACEQVAGLTFQVAAGDRVCRVTLTLTRTTSGGRALTRTYVDQVAMMNR